MSRLGAILLQRCPRCLQGKIFRKLLRIRDSCAVCELPFEREPGYYMGAVYFGYGLGLAELAPTLLLLLRLGTPDAWLVLIASAQLVALSPWNFRYARALWLHFDHFLGLS